MMRQMATTFLRSDVPGGAGAGALLLRTDSQATLAKHTLRR